MTKITTINKAAMIAMRPQIEAALKELGEQLGIEFKPTNGTFGDSQGHFKLEMKVADPAIQEAAARNTFNIYCSSFGLEPEDFGKEFRAGYKRYKLLGFELKRSKYPIRVMDIGAGKVVLLTELAVPAIRSAV